MACTVKEIATTFQTTSPLFNFSASVAYPRSTAVGFIPICGITTNPIVLHTIQVDGGDVITVEQSVSVGAEYNSLINSFITPSTSQYRINVTNPCGATYNATYNISALQVFPITLVSYVKDGVTITVNQVFTNQDDIDAFFVGNAKTINSIGWIKVGDNSYTKQDSVLWGGFNFLYSGISFHTEAVIDSVDTETSTINKINTIENCGTSFGYQQTTCSWSPTVDGTSYSYYIITTLLSPGTFSAFFPQVDVLISYDGTTITKTFATSTEFIDYMKAIGFEYLGTDNNVFVLQNTQSAWNSIVFQSDIEMSIQQYVAKISLERNCVVTNVVASVVPPIPTTSPLIKGLICNVEKSIVSNGCKMVSYSRIGRNIQTIMDNQIKLLLMKAALSMYPDDDAVYDLQCFFNKRLANLR